MATEGVVKRVSNAGSAFPPLPLLKLCLPPLPPSSPLPCFPPSPFSLSRDALLRPPSPSLSWEKISRPSFQTLLFFFLPLNLGARHHHAATNVAAEQGGWGSVSRGRYA